MVFLKLSTDEGFEGIGECAYHNALLDRLHVEALKDFGESFIIGADPFQIEKIYSTIYEQAGLRNSGPVISPVLSAFEMALWDIVGKATKQPVYNLLGGKVHEKLRAYSYLPGWRMGEPAEKAVAAVLAYRAQGFTAVKLGIDPTNNPGHLRYLENVVKAVRTALGDTCDILIGAHGETDTATAIRFAKRVETYDPLWYEEPVAPENIKEMARVARATSIPIATGERLLSKYHFAALLAEQAASVLQMDLSIVGGLLEAKKIAGMAEVHYAHIAPHMWGGPIGVAASIQLDMCCHNFLIQEYHTWAQSHAQTLLTQPIQCQNGMIIPPTAPGLGVELNEEIMRRYVVHQNQ